MERKEFIRKSCAACLSMAGLGVLMGSCNSTKYITGQLGKDGLTIGLDEFSVKGKENALSYIIIRNDALQYPICVYRLNDNNYSALWMKCTHQGAELQVAGDYLQCSAHGSEFDNKGTVKSGPAGRNLRNFPVTLTNNQLFIDLRAI